MLPHSSIPLLPPSCPFPLLFHHMDLRLFPGIAFPKQDAPSLGWHDSPKDPPFAARHLLLRHCLDLLLHSYCNLAKVDESGEHRKNTHYYNI